MSTITNELCHTANKEKLLFYLENQDVIKGVSFCATLDFTTCLVCAALDGYIWRIPEDIENIISPPCCQNCRCVLLPVTELSEIGDSTRPAASANFVYNAAMRYESKYPTKDWNQLSAATQHKYYHVEQRLFEEETKHPAFEQVPQKMNFSDWLHTKSDEQQSQYLGDFRAKLFQDLNLSLLDFIDLTSLTEIPRSAIMEKYCK